MREGERGRERGGKFLMECLVLNDVYPEGKEDELSIVQHYHNIMLTPSR